MNEQILKERRERIRIIVDCGGIESALTSSRLPHRITTTLSEALILGLLRQGVSKFLGIFGHGSTEIAEVLRAYEEAGLVRTYAVRHETEAVHAAMALRWINAEKSAVVTSIGPGALHALAGSLAPASDGIGVWFLLGDETTEDEGPNMQQIPGHDQDRFVPLFAAMGRTYKLHTPEALSTALRRGLITTQHPFRAGPFFLLMPMNTQPQILSDFNLQALPSEAPPKPGPAADEGAYGLAARAISRADKVVVKIGGGARWAGHKILELIDLAGAVAVTSPIVSGVIPFQHERNMTVGGSKGSLSGNYAMEQADLLIAVGTRFVCQSDCSRTGYPRVQKVININADVDTALHYVKTIALVGDIEATLDKLNETLKGDRGVLRAEKTAWIEACKAKRLEWDRFRATRYGNPRLYDPHWEREVLTQPAAIKTASDWARENRVICFFDAGDVQANGFQIVEDDRPDQTFTETGASYMGFAVSALMATAMARNPFYALAFSGDGSFVMNPQILIDGVAHGATGCILLLDNRRMGAISGLQRAQYGKDYATSDGIEVDYLSWARSVKGVDAFDGGNNPETLRSALNRAKNQGGLTLVHVPVYFGDDPLGGMGAFGRWNVGNWCVQTQALRHRIGI